MEALAKRVDELEKRPQLPIEPEPKPALPKTMVTVQKQYHTVSKGETLTKISRRHGITVEELRKLNNLSGNQGVRTGQKLLISARQ